MNPRTCPNCKIEILLNEGYHFDEKLNLICDNCGKTAFLTEKEDYKPIYNSSQNYRTILPIQPMDQTLNLDKL
mgnify:CR=1 FL=1